MNIRTLILAGVFCILTLTVQSQTVFSEKDAEIYDEYMEWVHQYRGEPLNKLIIITAKHIAHPQPPYVEGTLDRNSNEQLVINLSEFDCTTFVETCIALSKTVKSGDTSKENYAKILTNIRYRGGEIDGYTSRLHYMTDWIYDGEQKGFLKDISLKNQGEEKDKKINFMSSHSNSYKQLKKNKVNINKMKAIEDSINGRHQYNVIRTSRVPNIEWAIEDGDIIFFASLTGGLDYSHMVIAYKRIDGLKFIHASSQYKVVIEDNRTLYYYLYKSRSIGGITIVRVK